MNKIKEGILIEYKNATAIKYKNKRVMVVDLPESEYGLNFRYIPDDMQHIDEPAAMHKVLRSKIKLTTLRITEESAVALYVALEKRLIENGVLKIQTPK